MLNQLQARNLLGTYHLVLVNEFLKNEMGYRQLFLNKGYFIILDNSAVEQGYPNEGMLAYAAHKIGATCVCVPDFLEEMDKTVAAAERFLRGYVNMKWDFTGVMLIPQGKTYDEIVMCARDLYQMAKDAKVPSIYWGVPRWIANKLGSRMPIIKNIHEMLYHAGEFREPNIHLLGMSKNFTDDLECARLDEVMGLDSANPLVLGQLGHNLWMNYSHLERGKFWEETVLHEQTAYNTSELRRYINKT